MLLLIEKGRMLSNGETEQRKIAAASDLKRFLQSMKSVGDYEHRVMAARAQVTAAVESICKDDGCTCFDDEQVRVLTALVMHVIVMQEPSLQENAGFFRGLGREFSKASNWGKVGYVGLVLTILIGLGTIGNALVNFAKPYILSASPAEAQTEAAPVKSMDVVNGN